MESSEKINALQHEVERLTTELRRLRELGIQNDAARRATLYMLEDLEENRKTLEVVKREWTDAFDAVTDPIFIHDADYNVVRANMAYVKASGMALGAIIGRPYYSCFPKSDGPMESCLKNLRKKLSDTEVEEIRLGTDKIYHSRAFSIHDDAGTYQHSIHIMHDITERRRAENALEANEAWLSSILASSPSGIALVTDRVIRFANDELCKQSGYTQEELVGSSTRMIYLNDENYQRVGQVIETQFKKNNFAEIEAQFRHKLGAVVDVWLRCSPINVNDLNQGVIFSVMDITHRKKMENELMRENRARRIISGSNSTLIHANNEVTLLHNICQLIAAENRYPIAWIVLIDNTKQQQFKLAAHAGNMSSDDITQLTGTLQNDALRQSPALIAIREAELQLVTDAQTYTHCKVCRDLAIRHGYHSMLIYPLMHGVNCIGSLTITSLVGDDFTTEEVALLQELADDVAYGVISLRSRDAQNHAEKQQRITLEKLKANIYGTVQAMADALETRDPYTAGHQRHVAKLATAIATEMGLSEDDIEGIRIAAAIHDLGKIYVPSEILSKPGRLSPLEFDLIKTHSQVGYDILKKIDFPWPVATMVWQHHERIDGSGYPQGLKGDDILLGARIIGVADVAEAIASHRPYRPALGINFALETLEKDMGTVFDEVVVNACLRLFREKDFKFDFSEH